MDFSLRTDLKAKHLSCVEQNADNACCVEDNGLENQTGFHFDHSFYFYILKIFINKYFFLFFFQVNFFLFFQIILMC